MCLPDTRWKHCTVTRPSFVHNNLSSPRQRDPIVVVRSYRTYRIGATSPTLPPLSYVVSANNGLNSCDALTRKAVGDPAQMPRHALRILYPGWLSAVPPDRLRALEARLSKAGRAESEVATDLPFDFAGTPIEISHDIHQKTDSCHNHNREQR